MPGQRTQDNEQTRAIARILLVVCCLSFATVPAFAQNAPEFVPIPHPELGQFEPGVQEALRQGKADFDVNSAESRGQQLGFEYAQLGMLYQAHHLQHVAEACYLNAIALAPEDPRWAHLLAYVYQETGRFREAAEYYQRVIELNPDYLPAQLRLAMTLMSDARLSEARVAFDKVLAAHPENVQALAGTGELALEDKRYADAIRLLERALELQPEADKLYYPLGLAYRATGQVEKAREILGKRGRGSTRFNDPILSVMSAFSQSAQMYMELGFAALIAKDYERAAENFQLSIRSNPEDVVAIATLGRVRELQGHDRQAMGLFDRALAISPQYAHANYYKGALLERSGDINAAVHFYNAAIQSDPDYLEPRFLLANALMRSRKFAAAASHYDYMAENAIDNAEVRYWAGLAWLAAGQCRRALTPLEEAVHLMPTQGALLLALARAYSVCPGASAEQRQLSLEVARQLYELKPGADTAMTFAMALASNGDYAEAQDYLAQTMFERMREGFQPTEFQQQTMERFRNGMSAEKAWSDDDPILTPPVLESASAPEPPARS